MGSLPIEQIKSAIKAINTVKPEVRLLQSKIAELGTVEDVRRDYGEQGVLSRANSLKAYQNEILKIGENTLNKVKAYRKEASDALALALTPNGDDITGENASDVALLQNNLITSRTQLKALVEKHNNRAFKTLAMQYAGRWGWQDEFTYNSADESLFYFVKQVFDNLEVSASEPTGYNALQYTGTEGEYRRLAESWNVSEDFHDSNGNSIDSVVME